MLEALNATDPRDAGGAYKTTRGLTRYSADAGGAFAEVIVRSMFGYDPPSVLTGSLLPPAPDPGWLYGLLYKPQQPRGTLKAILRNVPLPLDRGHVTIEVRPGEGLILETQSD